MLQWGLERCGVEKWNAFKMATHILILILWTGPGIFVYWLCVSTSSILLRLFVYLRVRSDIKLWQAQYRQRTVTERKDDADA